MSLILGLPLLALFVATITLVLLLCRVCLRFIERFTPEAYDRDDPHCTACGYNLRGTIAAERDTCPECGEPVGKGVM